MRRKEKLLLVLSLTLALPATPVLAHQPSDVVRVAETISAQGPSKQVTGSFTLQNQGAIPLSVRIPPLRTAALEFRYAPAKVILEPGKQAEVRFAGAFYKDGKWQVAPRVEYSTTNGTPVGGLHADSYFLVKQGRFFKSTYAELFLKRDLRDRQLGEFFRAAVTPVNVPRSPEYRMKRPSAEDTLKRAKELPSAKVSLSPVEDGPAQFLAARYHYSPDFKRFHDSSSPPRSVRLHGNFSWLGTDGSLHPAWLWTVTVYTGRDGDWRLAGSDAIRGDGDWEVSLDYTDGSALVVYSAESLYFTPRDVSDVPYAWAHVMDRITDTVEVGSYYADGPPGLGEIYNEAMTMYVALIWNAEVNPLHRHPIKAVFPNTGNACRKADGLPWSCYRGTTIWITSDHALWDGTVMHELAHDLQDKFWSGDLGPGGDHALTACYNPTLALREGFADFMPDWVMSERGATNPFYYGFAIENPSTACMSPLARNESWVAAALWDLHDSNNEGADTAMFPGSGDVVKIFLGAENALREPRVPGRPALPFSIRSMATAGRAYKLWAREHGDSPSEASIDDILRQDFIIP